LKEKSKGVVKERTNFVRINMQKNYKPVMRGGAFTNKIMAKKRNALKFRESFKRRMQIERAKSRDQVNVYGGLGKVGLDHDGAEGDADKEELAPGFSESALKYVKDIMKKEMPEEDEEEEEDLLDEN
jgi:hypothetical protein